MYPSSYDLKGFYNSYPGRIVRRLLRQHILQIWPDMKGLRLMGYGYATPYLKPYLEEAERVFALMPSGQGAHAWPQEDGNLVCLNDETDLPIETNSIDRAILIHTLEFTDTPEHTFEELWRVMKSSGRLLVIVPNRLGMWARADWNPLGQGTPYSGHQVERFLAANQFVHENTRKALFIPPFKNDFFLRSAGFFEQIGQFLYPALGGIQIVEASKQLYAGKGLTARTREPVRLKKAAQVKPVPSPRQN